MSSWKTGAIGLLFTALGGGGTWVVSTVVKGESLHAAQVVEAAKQDEQLHDHELRTRSLEGVVQQQQALQQVAQ
jgi:hypothetical protein